MAVPYADSAGSAGVGPAFVEQSMIGRGWMQSRINLDVSDGRKKAHAQGRACA
jgi:hypothetical protein